ncbi:MaoC/PaaZ C-terminal domain-containing protein [Nocardiopsis composta]
MTRQAEPDARSAEFTVPAERRYLEDYPVGARDEFGGLMVEESEIIEFARRFDPQSFHTDPEAARHGPFGGLVASGWHTASLMMRMYAEHYLSPPPAWAAPGWTNSGGPRRCGRATRCGSGWRCWRTGGPAPSRPRVLRTAVEVVNQDGAAVLRMTVLTMVRCRTAPGG